MTSQIANLSRAASSEFLSGIDVEECGFSSLELAQCNALSVQLAIFVTELLKPHGRTIRYVFNRNKSIYNQMLEQSIDLLPTPIALRDSEEDATYFHTLPSYALEYDIFGSSHVEISRRRSAPSSLHFLFAPFTPAVWLIIGASLLLASGVENVFIRKLANKVNSFGTRTSLVAISLVAMIGVFYNIELKALAVLPDVLLDLADSVRQGERVIIVDNNRSVRWDLLTKQPRGLFRSESWQAIYEAVRKRGIDKALLHEPNMAKICHLLKTSPIYVYIGLVEKLRDLCGIRGLIKHYTIEYPVYTHVGVATTSPAAKDASTLLHAYQNYRSIALKRLNGWIREPEKRTKTAPLIGAECVGAGGLVLGVGCAAGLVALGMELVWKRRNDGRRYNVSS